MTPHTSRMLHDLFSLRQYSQSPFGTQINCQVITNYHMGRAHVCFEYPFFQVSACKNVYPRYQKILQQERLK